MKLKSQNRTCVFTVIYPGYKKYWSDYINSLTSQDNSAFDLFLLNDGIKDFDDQDFLPDGINMVEIPVSGSIPQIRELGISLLKESQYDYIIFTDVDDYFQQTG